MLASALDVPALVAEVRRLREQRGAMVDSYERAQIEIAKLREALAGAQRDFDAARGR